MLFKPFCHNIRRYIYSWCGILTFGGPCIVAYSYNKTNKMRILLQFILGIEVYMFRTVSLYIIRSLALYTQQYIQVMLTACKQSA
jgi:hypothetical protein